MSNGIQRLNSVDNGEIVIRYTFPDLQAMAAEVAKSGLFKMTAPQILTLMLVAESEGVHPVRALMMYDVIDGRPALKAVTMVARFQQAGGKIQWRETSDEAAEAVFSHPTANPDGVAVRYTIEDAKRAQLAHKDNWKKNPADMLVARVSSRGVRRCLPGVIMGLYDPDEVEPAAPPAQQTAHDELRKKLQARREAGQRERAPAAIEPAPEAAIEPEAKSEFREWVDEQLEEFNREPGVKVINAYQVANHLIKVGVAEGIVDEKAITRPDGKRDKDAAALLLNVLWEEEGGWVMDTAGKYLAEKSVEGLKATAEPAGNGSSTAPVQQALPV